eukprot:COSAG01_NODE_11517_length_1916_cov_61.290323_2_plen_88_part_00
MWLCRSALTRLLANVPQLVPKDVSVRVLIPPYTRRTADRAMLLPNAAERLTTGMYDQQNQVLSLGTCARPRSIPVAGGSRDWGLVQW